MTKDTMLDDRKLRFKILSLLLSSLTYDKSDIKKLIEDCQLVEEFITVGTPITIDYLNKRT